MELSLLICFIRVLHDSESQPSVRHIWPPENKAATVVVEKGNIDIQTNADQGFHLCIWGYIIVGLEPSITMISLLGIYTTKDYLILHCGGVFFTIGGNPLVVSLETWPILSA
jgi:hypothetical protein